MTNQKLSICSNSQTTKPKTWQRRANTQGRGQVFAAWTGRGERADGFRPLQVHLRPSAVFAASQLLRRILPSKVDGTRKTCHLPVHCATSGRANHSKPLLTSRHIQVQTYFAVKTFEARQKNKHDAHLFCLAVIERESSSKHNYSRFQTTIFCFLFQG